MLRWLNTVSLEMRYPFTLHVDISIMRRDAAHKLLKQKGLGQAEKNARKLTVEIFLFSTIYTCRLISARARVLVVRTLIRSNVRAIILLTFIGNVNKRQDLKIYFIKLFLIYAGY